MNLSRLKHILKKEFIQFFGDKRLVAQVLIAPILQLILFGYVVSTDVKNINTIVFDQDRSAQSRGIIKKFSSSGYFRIKDYAGSIEDIKKALDDNSASVALNIPPDFSKLLAGGHNAPMQIIVDGTNSNNAGIALNYAQRIIQAQSKDLILEKFNAANGKLGSFNLPDPSIRIWFNPELKSVYYMVPGLVAMLLTIITMLLTSVAIVKEREQGTMEQLIVTPVRKIEIILGKTLPFVIVAFIQIILVITVGSLWFHVPIRGSIGLLFLCSFIFLFTTLGLGILFSTISQSQQEALIGAFLFFLVAMLLSGFIFPIESMPDWIQPITYIVPLRYFLVILRGIFLKGVGIKLLWHQGLAMIAFSILIFTVAIVRFNKKIG